LRSTAGVNRRAAASRPAIATRSRLQPLPVVLDVDEKATVSVLGGVGSPVSPETVPVLLVDV
jgi:hypothetical protein